MLNYKQKTFLKRKPKLGDKEMVKIIKVEIQKWGGVEVEQKDGPCAIRKKKREKKHMVAKFVCLKGGKVSRRNGSVRGSWSRSQCQFVGWYLSSTSRNKAADYDVRDVCVSEGGRDPFAQPH